MRYNKFGCAGLVIALGLAMAGSTSYADDEELPAVHTVPCLEACANSTGAVADFHPIPNFPRGNIDWYGVYVEGYVMLHYTITPEGRVKDIAVLELVGPKNFLDSTLSTVKDWTYKPATLDGKPVAICRTLLVTFTVDWAEPGGREQVVHLYERAVGQIKESKLDEAMATLSEGQGMPRLNFYERGMLANLASMIYLQKGDYLEARRLARLATDHGLEELKPAVVRNLWETRIKASLALGDLVDALDSIDHLKKMPFFDPNSPIAKLVEDSRARVENAPVFGTDAKIPETGSGGNGVSVGLYRRNFTFTNITGSLDRFTLSCKQQAVESKITATAEWHIPKSWSDCHVLIRGAPGTTFRLAQATE